MGKDFAGRVPRTCEAQDVIKRPPVAFPVSPEVDSDESRGSKCIQIAEIDECGPSRCTEDDVAQMETRKVVHLFEKISAISDFGVRRARYSREAAKHTNTTASDGAKLERTNAMNRSRAERRTWRVKMVRAIASRLCHEFRERDKILISNRKKTVVRWTSCDVLPRRVELRPSSAVDILRLGKRGAMHQKQREKDPRWESDKDLAREANVLPVRRKLHF